MPPDFNQAPGKSAAVRPSSTGTVPHRTVSSTAPVSLTIKASLPTLSTLATACPLSPGISLCCNACDNVNWSTTPLGWFQARLTLAAALACSPGTL